MLSDSDTDEDLRITINEHYANAYTRKKEREELTKLKEKYGSDLEDISGPDSEDSEDSDVSDDEDGEELTPAMDAAILRTLARIKRKDPDIYNNEKHIFEEEKTFVKEPTSLAPQKTKGPKPLTVKQQALSAMLNPTSRSPSPQPPTYEQEQQALRAEAISAFHNAVEHIEADEDLLVTREKGKDEIEKEEEEYRDFLAREVGEDIEALIGLDSELKDINHAAVVDKTPKRRKESLKEDPKANPNQVADEKFLMNYILNRGWIDRDAKRIPTYKEITHIEKPVKENDIQDIEADDEEFEEIVDTFESSYNFRFEEPEGATIATFPRSVASTVRRHDPKRKEARERRKQRREEELNKKREEVKRLKSLKAKELRAKLEKLGKEGGIDSEVLANFDLDDDWDPQKHDEQMEMMYAGDEEGQEDEKPRWDYDISIDDALQEKMSDFEAAPKTKKKGKRKRVDDEEDTGVSNADAMHPPEDWDGTEEMRKKKVQEYLDEVYGMEFNDIVGDIPTRFSYTQVASENYGLGADEILMATDTELNQFMGLKKLASYRKDRRGYDASRIDRLKEFRAKINSRKKDTDNFMADAMNANVERPSKKRKGRRERQKLKNLPTEQQAETNT